MTTKQYSCFDVSLKDHVLEVVLNRPSKLNTMNAEFFAESRQIFEAASLDDNVRCVLLHANVRKRLVYVLCL
jgi:enoyl-CoA hydratase/carnithine racemase